MNNNNLENENIEEQNLEGQNVEEQEIEEQNIERQNEIEAKNLENKNISSMDQFFEDNWRFIVIVCSFLIIFGSIFINKTNIQFKLWELRKMDSNFIEYIDNNYTNQDKIKYVNNAIDLLAELHTEDGFKFINKIYVDEDTNIEVRNHLLDTYLKYPDKKPLIKTVYNHALIGLGDLNKLKTLIESYDHSELTKVVAENLKLFVKNDNWDEMIEYIDFHNSLGFKNIEILEQVSAKLNQLKIEENKIIEINDEFQNKTSSLDELKNDYKIMLIDLDTAKLKKENALNKLKEAESEYNNFLQTWVIDFYVVGLTYEENNINLYEIAPAKYDYYGNMQLSMDRANLYTRDVVFSSKGWASLSVVNGGSEEVKLKEELGNFVQEWPVYIESSLYEDTIGEPFKIAYESAKTQYQDSVDAYNELINSKASMEADIKKEEKEIKELQIENAKENSKYIEKNKTNVSEIKELIGLLDGYSITDTFETKRDDKNNGNENDSAIKNKMPNELKKELMLYQSELAYGLEAELQGEITHVAFNGLKFFKGQFARACDEGYIDDNDRTFINASLENIENVLHNNNKTSDELKEALNLSNKIKSRIERYSVDE